MISNVLAELFLIQNLQLPTIYKINCITLTCTPLIEFSISHLIVFFWVNVKSIGSSTLDVLLVTIFSVQSSLPLKLNCSVNSCMELA